jgi:DNA-binding winged helix-turn-helix (wHTH) protein
MVYLFHDYELDESLFELRQGGAPIKLEPKVFDVLIYLIQHCTRVVTKGELHARLWPEVCVSDDALVRCIVQARKALADKGSERRVIKTVYRRGYQFVAPLARRDEVHRESRDV